MRGPNGPRRGADLRNLGLIQDGAVLIVDGLIQEVGSSRRVENLGLARQAREVDATGRVVMPGFVDSYMRLLGLAPTTDPPVPPNGAGRAADLMALARSVQELSPRNLGTQAQNVIKEAVRHGTTTLESKSGFGLSESGEIKILRLHQALEKQPVPVVSTFVCTQAAAARHERPDQFLDWICSHALPLMRRRKLADFAEIRCEEGGFDPEQARRFLSRARECGFSLKLQSGECPGAGLVRLAVELEAASLEHPAEFLSEDLGWLARSDTIAMLLPGAIFYLGRQRYPPARVLIDAGAAVALATNYNPETSPSQNMQMMLTLACRRMNMTPAEAISAATVNAAFALRRGSSIGSLEKGKLADLIILGVPDYREIPYHFGINLVDLVMSRGEALVERAEVKWPVS